MPSFVGEFSYSLQANHVDPRQIVGEIGEIHGGGKKGGERRHRENDQRD
jgi:hypothetical protein